MNQGYFHDPTIFGSKIAFISEDDLWIIDLETDKNPRRIISLNKPITTPCFSPSGDKIAYSCSNDGAYEVYVLDLISGESKRLTYLGMDSYVRAWNPHTNEIIFDGNFGLPNHARNLFAINSEGGEPKRLSYGVSMTISYSITNNGLVIGRFKDDNATKWKHYKGGLAGQIWIDPEGKNNFFKPQLPLGNHVRPMFVDDRIYFLSDYEGASNLYSISLKGNDLRKHTNSEDFYFRKANSDGKRIIMQKAGDLYIKDPSTNLSQQVKFDYISSKEKTKHSIIKPNSNIESIQTNIDASYGLLVARGKAYYFPLWEEGVLQVGEPQGIRYRHPMFHPDKKTLFLLSDRSSIGGVEIYDLTDLQKTPDILELDLGIPYSAKLNSKGSHIAIVNNRNQIIIVDIQKKTSEIVHQQQTFGISNIDWSPDSQWLTWVQFDIEETSTIVIYHLNSKKSYPVSEGYFYDFNPIFDPNGRYLYFLSRRSYKPLIDQQTFQYDFPKPTKIYAISLKREFIPPTNLRPRPLDASKNITKNGDKKDIIVEIDFENIVERIIALPVPEDRIISMDATEDRIFYIINPIDSPEDTNQSAGNILKVLSLEDLEIKQIMAPISFFRLSPQKNALNIVAKDRIRVLPVDFSEKSDQQPKEDDKPSRKSKWLNLNRIAIEIDSIDEWKQMMKETVKLMKDHYWDANLGNINWNNILERYISIVNKLGSREDFIDLLWELQSESMTSHSYVTPIPTPMTMNPGFIGADLEYDHNYDGYKITHIIQGDNYDQEIGSPLASVAADVKVGDIIVAVNGRKVSQTRSVQECLVGKAGEEIYLTILSPSSGSKKKQSIKTLRSDTNARYREWVKKNRAYVTQKTNGRVGYIHLPDMYIDGIREFFRHYKIESQKDALIVDVRYNRGGHVSQLVLEKLNHKAIGYAIVRYGKPTTYPESSVIGPIIALTNEHAGSDGDIFSHSFKLFKLGTLIGTRTWGGVIGIHPRVQLVDGTTVTQPEFCYWFTDVQWGVENYGTVPDIEVEITPNDYINGQDPQLDKTIEVILRQLNERSPKRPSFDNKPSKV